MNSSFVSLVLCLAFLLKLTQANIVLQDQKKRGHIVMTDDNIIWKGNLFDQGDSDYAEHSVEHVWAYPPHNHHHHQHQQLSHHDSSHSEYAFIPHSYGWNGGSEHEMTAGSSATNHWSSPSHTYFAFARPVFHSSMYGQAPHFTSPTLSSSSSAAASSSVRASSSFSSFPPQSSAKSKSHGPAVNRVAAESSFHPLMSTLFPITFGFQYPVSIPSSKVLNKKTTTQTNQSLKENERRSSEEAEEDVAERLITQEVMKELGQDLFI